MDTAAAHATEVVVTPAAPIAVARSQRLPSIDRLRGLVIALMALDHVRDYFTNAHFAPTDLAHTTPALFFTRWITHYCAPIFIFLAGTSARLYARRTTRAGLSRFLLSRGLWLVALEFSVVSFVWTFNFRYPMGLVMQVIWAVGVSMCVLSALVALPNAAIAAFAVIMIAGHNLLDGVTPEAWGSAAWLWRVLHVQSKIAVGSVIYPLIPWLGVIAAGYVFGGVYELANAPRRKLTLRLGVSLTVLFIALRLLNLYGDPSAWSSQTRPLFTLLSFLNVTKYPPSLLYLLMTIGPGLLLLTALDRGENRVLDVLHTFGRVPLFAYVVHLAIAHLLAGVVALALGFGSAVLTNMFMSYPPTWGFGLGGVYAAWLTVLLLLYPLCRWFADVKRRRNDWWLSYL